VLLSDTVGFIRNLPHNLIASFKATLEEARQADLLLHVADASNPAVFEQIASVFRVLEELHIDEKDAVLVLNKVDAAASRHHIDRLLARYPNAVPVSAKTRHGLAQLAATVSDALSRNFIDVDIETGVGNGRLLAYLAAHGEVLSQRYQDSRVIVHCRISREHLGRIHEDATSIRPRVNGFASGHAAITGNGHAHGTGDAADIFAAR
jgi:GTP-binding protein HflX